ncbi:MAG TPA: Hsp20/alpha crystallin family protein [Thermodesulfobacteriota bacterium]|nr:Hsp20/alpha crystallin family protein [Thermodesulfobacteriota bacterium]
MAIVRWDPFRDLAALHERMNRLFEETFGRTRGEAAELSGTWWPATDVYETADGFQIVAELPGLSKDDVQVELKDNVLTLKGERRYEEKYRDQTAHRVERCYGQFSRSFALPAEVDASKVEARFKDGVLTISVPKAAAAKPRLIPIAA